MRELLTDFEVELLKTYASYNMRLRPTAKAVHYNPRTVYAAMTAIMERTGSNPLSFDGLCSLIQAIREEDEGGG